MGANGLNTRPLNTRPRAILFDWDNTLIDSWPVIHDAINATFKAFGLDPWTMDQTRQRVRKSLRDSFPGLFGERWEEAGEFFYERFAAIHIEKLQPLPGAEPMLAELKGLGVYLGVISNKKGDFLRREASRLGWSGYFGGLVGATDAERDKPAIEPVDLALHGSGVARGGDVWIVGDADIDMECALNAGCVPILVRENSLGDDEFNVHKPLRRFEGLQELINYIREL